jgi:hypothetical protein
MATVRTVRKASDRNCTRCGKVYYRCNKFHVWDKQNPGHRGGWHKAEERVCTDCGGEKAVVKVISVVQAFKPVRVADIIQLNTTKVKAG